MLDPSLAGVSFDAPGTRKHCELPVRGTLSCEPALCWIHPDMQATYMPHSVLAETGAVLTESNLSANVLTGPMQT